MSEQEQTRYGMPAAAKPETGDSRAAPSTGPRSGKSICVYLAGNLGSDELYRDEADTLGCLMAADGIGLVYGGAKVGLMGVLANAVLANGGFVTGVVPRQLSYQELAHEGLNRLVEVSTMHERKHLMQQFSQGCIALPGGYGTLEEFFEVLCWSQEPLYLLEKPSCIANIGGYYDHVFTFLDRAVEEGLLRPQNRALARQSPTATGALQMIQKAWADEEQAMDDVIKAYGA